MKMLDHPIPHLEGLTPEECIAVIWYTAYCQHRELDDIELLLVSMLKRAMARYG